MVHPEDAAPLGIATGDWVRLRNERGAVLTRARHFEGVRRGVLIAESIWPNDCLPGRPGINTLTPPDPIARTAARLSTIIGSLWREWAICPERSGRPIIPGSRRWRALDDVSLNNVRPPQAARPPLATRRRPSG
jgi:hypothetical protein